MLVVVEDLSGRKEEGRVARKTFKKWRFLFFCSSTFSITIDLQSVEECGQTKRKLGEE